MGDVWVHAYIRGGYRRKIFGWIFGKILFDAGEIPYEIIAQEKISKMLLLKKSWAAFIRNYKDDV